MFYIKTALHCNIFIRFGEYEVRSVELGQVLGAKGVFLYIL